MFSLPGNGLNTSSCGRGHPCTETKLYMGHDTTDLRLQDLEGNKSELSYLARAILQNYTM